MPEVISNPNPKDWQAVFSWDSLLDKAAAGAEGAIASAILKDILGPSAWEKQVTSDLTLIIHKLEEILAAIEALKKYIPVALIEQWRNETLGKLTAAVNRVLELMAGVRAAGGKLTNITRPSLVNAESHLNDILGEIVNTSDKGTPLGMPMYAATAAGIVQLVIAQRVLGLPSATTQLSLDNYKNGFNAWAREVERQAQEWDLAVDKVAKYFATMPKSACVAWSDPGGSPNLLNSPDPPVGMVIAWVYGGFNADWTYYIGIQEYAKWSIAMNVDDSTFPQLKIYGVPRPHLRPESTQEWDSLELGRAYGEARFKSGVLQDLAAKRSAALDYLNNAQGLRAVGASMKAAIARFDKLRPTT